MLLGYENIKRYHMLDQNRLDELRKELATEDIHDIVELFVKEAGAAIAALKAAQTTEQVKKHAHFLHGNSKALGLAALADACRDIEYGHHHKTHDFDPLEGLLSQSIAILKSSL